MAMEPGSLFFTPIGSAEWESPTSLYLVEEQENGEWIVAVPSDAGTRDTVTVPTLLGEQEPVELMRTPLPAGLVSVPPRGALQFDFEQRSGDSLSLPEVQRRIPRSLVSPPPPQVSEATLAALQQRITQLESQSTGPAEAPLGRRLFGPRGAAPVDLDRARRLAGTPPLLGGARPPKARNQATAPVPSSPSETADGQIARIVGALESLASSKRREGGGLEDREEADGVSGITTGGGKGIARLRALAERYGLRPSRRWEHVSEVAQLAGCETVTAYMEQCTQMRRDRLTAFLVTMVCRIAAAAEEGDIERALGRCASALMFLDQWSIDGNVQLAWQLTLEPEPPVLRRHPDTPLTRAFNQKGRRSPFPQQQFSQLAEPQVTEAALAATKNWKEFKEAAAKLHEEA